MDNINLYVVHEGGIWRLLGVDSNNVPIVLITFGPNGAVLNGNMQYHDLGIPLDKYGCIKIGDGYGRKMRKKVKKRKTYD